MLSNDFQIVPTGLELGAITQIGSTTSIVAGKQALLFSWSRLISRLQPEERPLCGGLHCRSDGHPGWHL